MRVAWPYTRVKGLVAILSAPVRYEYVPWVRQVVKGIWRLIAGGDGPAGLALPPVVFLAIESVGQLVFAHRLVPWGLAVGMIAFVAGYVTTILVLVKEVKQLHWWRLLQMGRTRSDLRQLSWREFERFVAGWFAKEGWKPDVVGRAGPDGGIDIVMKRGRDRAIVQCKLQRGPEAYIEERPVREFAGVILAERANVGYFVTSGVFSPEAVSFATKVPTMKLVCGDDLVAGLDPCPTCQGPMRVKLGKFGLFQSCMRYSKCPGSKDLPQAA